MRININWERAQSTALLIASIGVASALVHREFFNAVGAPPVRKSTRVTDWRSLVSAGRILGDKNAPVKVIEFADLQCPFCKNFNSKMKDVSAKYGRRVALVFVHFPLQMHPYATAAARAAECAAGQGRFAAMIDTLYGDQASFGTRPWMRYATAAGVGDSTAFSNCMADTGTPTLLQSGLDAGHRLSLVATPTVLVNDWRFGKPPSDSELNNVIDKALAAESKR